MYIALLQPVLNAKRFGPDRPTRAAQDTISTDSFGRLFAVCVSDKEERKHRGDKDILPEWVESYRWSWKGVYK